MLSCSSTPTLPLSRSSRPFVRQQEERGAVAQDRVADDGQDPLDELVEAAGGVRGVADGLELPESVLRVFGRRPRATLVLVRPDAVERDRRLMRDGQQEAALLGRHHVIAMEPEAQRSEDLRPERHRDAGEPAESGVAFDLPDDRESREQLAPGLDEDRPAGSHDLRARQPGCRSRVVSTRRRQARPGRSRPAPGASRGRRRCGPSARRRPLRAPRSLRRRSPSRRLPASSRARAPPSRPAAGGAGCRRGARARPQLARSSSAWRSLPEMTPAPTAATSQTNMENWDPGSKSVTSGTNTRPPTRLTSAPASGPQTIAAATEMSAPRPPGTPSKLPGRTSAKSRSTATCARTKPGIHRGFQIQRASGPGLRARRAVRFDRSFALAHRRHAPTSISNQTSLRSFVITPHRSASRSTRYEPPP